jgi:hypothetical protein
MKKKTVIITCAALSVLIPSYFLFFRKAEIIFVQHIDGVTDIVVKKFPITQRGRVSWWEDNQDMLKDKYGIPERDKNGVYYIAISDVSDGFKKASEANFSAWYSLSRSDLLCFDEIKSENRCIEKNVLMEIMSTKVGEINYMFDGEFFN